MKTSKQRSDDFRKWFQAQRLRKRFTVTRIAEKSGVPLGTIWPWLASGRTLSADKIASITFVVKMTDCNRANIYRAKAKLDALKSKELREIFAPLGKKHAQVFVDNLVPKEGTPLK